MARLIQKISVKIDEDEPPYDPRIKEKEVMVEECSKFPDEEETSASSVKKASSDYIKASKDEFLALPVDTKKIAKSFIYKYGPDVDH